MPNDSIETRYGNAVIKLDLLQREHPELTTQLLEAVAELIVERMAAEKIHGKQEDKTIENWIDVVNDELGQLIDANCKGNSSEMLRQSLHLASTSVHLMQAVRSKVFPKVHQDTLPV